MLWEHCHMVWLRLRWQLSWRCLSGHAGRRAPDSHTPPGGWHILTHTNCVLGCLTPPPTHSPVLTLSRSPRTSLFMQPNKTERSSANHVAQGLEKVYFLLKRGPWLHYMMQQGVSDKCFFCQWYVKVCVNVMSETCGFFLFAVCNKMTKYRAISPFLCMDMTYITCLLKEGFGFKDSTVLQVRKRVKEKQNMKSYMTQPSV